MRAIALYLAVGVLLAGCLTPSATLPERDEEPGEIEDTGVYRFIELGGYFRMDSPEGMASACGFPSTPAIDEQAQTIRFYNERFDVESTRVLVVGIIWDQSGCGVARTFIERSLMPHGAVETELPGYGEVTFDPRPDGTLLLNGFSIAPGAEEAREFHGTTDDGRKYSARITVTNHGNWPNAGVTVAGDMSAHMQ